jgi:hypothetical protein
MEKDSNSVLECGHGYGENFTVGDRSGSIQHTVLSQASSSLSLTHPLSDFENFTVIRR